MGCGSLTRVGLHVLQQVVVELELDPTGATRVGFCGEKRSIVLGAEGPWAPSCWAVGRFGTGDPQHTRGLWAQPDLPLALTGEGEAGGRKDRWGEEDVRPQRASDGSGSHSLSAYCVPGTVLGTGDGREEGPGALRQRRVLQVPQPICRPVEAHRHHGLLSKRMS